MFALNKKDTQTKKSANFYVIFLLESYSRKFEDFPPWITEVNNKNLERCH